MAGECGTHKRSSLKSLQRIRGKRRKNLPDNYPQLMQTTYRHQ